MTGSTSSATLSSMGPSFLTAGPEMPRQEEGEGECVYVCQRVDPALVSRSSFLTGLKGFKGLACLPEGVAISDFHHWLACDSRRALMTPRELATALKVAHAIGDSGARTDAWLAQLAATAKRVSWVDISQWDAVSSAVLSLSQAMQTRLLHAWLGAAIPIAETLAHLPLTLHPAILTACMTAEGGLEVTVPIHGHVILATLSQFHPPVSPLTHLHVLFEDPSTAAPIAPAGPGPSAQHAMVAQHGAGGLMAAPQRAQHAHALSYSTNAVLLARTLAAHSGVTSLHISHGGLCADALATLAPTLHCTGGSIKKLRVSHDPLLMRSDALAAFAHMLRGMSALQVLEWEADACMQPAGQADEAVAAHLPVALSAAVGVTRLALSGPRWYAADRIVLPHLQTLEIEGLRPATPPAASAAPVAPATAGHVCFALPSPPLPLPAMFDCPMLTALSLRESGSATDVIGDAAAAATFAAIKDLLSLRRLELACTRPLSHSALTCMQTAISDLTALTYLRVITADSRQFLYALPMALAGIHGTLAELRVSAGQQSADGDTPVDASWGPFLAGLGQCRVLQTLYLRIEADIDVPALGEVFANLNALKSLEVFDENAGEAESVCVAPALVRGLPAMPALETLTLSVLTSAGAQERLCGSLQKLRALTRLSLDFAVFAEPAAAEPLLAHALGRLPALRELYVNADDLEDSWAAVVRGALRGKSLKEVHVTSADDTVPGFDKLSADAKKKGVELHLSK